MKSSSPSGPKRHLHVRKQEAYLGWKEYQQSTFTRAKFVWYALHNSSSQRGADAGARVRRRRLRSLVTGSILLSGPVPLSWYGIRGEEKDGAGGGVDDGGWRAQLDVFLTGGGAISQGYVHSSLLEGLGRHGELRGGVDLKTIVLSTMAPGSATSGGWC